MKKQILKTCVAAALCLGMGMAHAATNVSDSASVVVSGFIGAPTCALDIDKPGIKVGSVLPGDFLANGTLVKPQSFAVSLTGCASHVGVGKASEKLDLKITGSQTKDGDGYFGDSNAVVGSLAVGLTEDGKSTLLKNDDEIELAAKGGDVNPKVFNVGLIVSDHTRVTPGQSVSVPLTFQLTTP